MSAGRLLVALSAAVLTIGLAAPALAKDAPLPKKGQGSPAQAQQQKAQKPPQAQQAGERKPAARKVVRLEEMRVEGRVQKPQALFVMPRASVDSGEQDRTESFLPEAKDAVKRDPF
ncbi:MAG TPA: hypothetical protein VMU15_22075 [Anaeromyxobacter sp.]|nr:hypothetical protein [Anaeromyxobacter sp.]